MLLKHSLKAFILRELTKAYELSFSELQTLTKATPGNLGSALNTLLRAKYVTKKPNTKGISIYRVSIKGNHAYSVYKNELK
jgi:DNA-binding MarR family transcriptional regulator